MARKSGELQRLAMSLGLDQGGTREMLMDRIRDFLIQRDKLDVLPQIDVMCAQNAKDFLDYTLEKPWRSPKLMEFWQSNQWAVEPKLDGVRVKAHFHPKYGAQPRLDSRRRSDVNFIYAEQTCNFPHLTLPEQPGDLILDGELMPPPGVAKIWNGAIWVEGLQICTSIWNSGQETSRNLQQFCYHPPDVNGQCVSVETPVTWGQLFPNRPQERGHWRDETGLDRGCLMHYHAFDIIRHNGEWLHDRPFAYRRALLEDVVLAFKKQNPYYHIVPIWHLTEGWCEDGLLEWETADGRLGEFEQLLEQGGEGVMFKFIHSPYEFSKRSWSWMKLKKFVEISAFIIGSVPATVGKGWEGLIGAFEVGVMQGDTPVHIASCSAMPLELRRQATGPDGALHPSFLNRVMEVRFQQVTSRSARGRHAVMVRWREDQCPNDCGFDQPGLTAHLSEMQEGS